MKPSDFSNIYPWSSVLRQSEHETIAKNILIILKRAGDKWRELTWDEYFSARKSDGASEHSIRGEKRYFDEVVGYTVNEKNVRAFSPKWSEVLTISIDQ